MKEISNIAAELRKVRVLVGHDGESEKEVERRYTGYVCYYVMREE